MNKKDLTLDNFFSSKSLNTNNSGVIGLNSTDQVRNINLQSKMSEPVLVCNHHIEMEDKELKSSKMKLDFENNQGRIRDHEMEQNRIYKEINKKSTKLLQNVKPTKARKNKKSSLGGRIEDSPSDEINRKTIKLEAKNQFETKKIHELEELVFPPVNKALSTKLEVSEHKSTLHPFTQISEFTNNSYSISYNPLHDKNELDTHCKFQ